MAIPPRRRRGRASSPPARIRPPWENRSAWRCSLPPPAPSEPNSPSTSAGARLSPESSRPPFTRGIRKCPRESGRPALHQEPRVGPDRRRDRHDRDHGPRPEGTRRDRVSRAARARTRLRRRSGVRHRRVGQGGLRALYPPVRGGRRGQQIRRGRARHRQRRSVRRRLAHQAEAFFRRRGQEADVGGRLRRVRPERREGEVKFLPTSDADRAEMLAAIGVSSVDDLFVSIPASVRQAPSLPPPLSEIEVRRMFGGLAKKNANAKESAFFLGAGLYHHYTSAIADQMLYRAEWLTAYTPYQPEVSQGTLQSIFEFQTHICLLTGLDVANASLYEGASALVEGLLMAERLVRGRKKVVLSAGIHPEYRETVRTYLANLDVAVVEVPLAPDGATDAAALVAAIDEKTFAVAVQSPNFYGIVEDWSAASAAAHAKGALGLAVVAEAASLALLAAPGEKGIDIACGEAQSLGVPMHDGGPILGFLACRTAHERQIPGRLVGQTRDAEGRRAFCLTLSTREQHIRREKATSNICTNQGLMALAANIHMSLLGKHGLREVAQQSHAKAEYLKGRISALPAYRLPYPGPTFNEFLVEGPRPAAPMIAELAQRGILAGVSLSRFGGPTNRFLVAVTEMNTREEMDHLVSALAEAGGHP